MIDLNAKHYYDMANDLAKRLGLDHAREQDDWCANAILSDMNANRFEFTGTRKELADYCFNNGYQIIEVIGPYGYIPQLCVFQGPRLIARRDQPQRHMGHYPSPDFGIPAMGLPNTTGSDYFERWMARRTPQTVSPSNLFRATTETE